MKKVLLSSALFLISFIGFSQTKGISYQAVIIDPNPIQIPGTDITAQPYVSKDVWVRFGIYAGTTLQYEELHKTKTDEYGLVNLIIGAGVNTGKAGTFTSLSWDGVTKSIITSVSFDQGGRYTEVSNQKLNYVPYTLLAETAVKLAGVLSIASGGTGATNAIAARTNLGLGNVDNTADVDKPVSIATLAILDTKEAIANKSTNIIADSASSVKYPSVKAIKDYVDSRTSSANNANLAAKATALETPRTINGVPFDGTANITIPVGVTPPDANATTKGLVQLAGDLSGTAAAPAIAANSVTTAKIIDGAITNAKITSVAGSKVTGDIAGNAATATLATTATSANTATKLTTARTINGTPFDGTSDITITTNASTLSGTIGILNGGTGASTAAGARTNLGLVIGTDVLAQRTFGTAANSAATDFVAATEKGANNGVATLGNNGKIPSTQIPAISFQNVNVVNSDAAMIGIAGAQVGSIAIRTDNNNNYVLSALPASTLSNWIALATPLYVSTVNGYAGPNVVLTTNDVAEGTTNKYFTDARVRNAISAVAPLNFNATSGVLSMTAASGSSDGYLSSADYTRFNNKQTALTAGVDYATPSGNITGNAANVTGIVSIANGGTGTSTASGALVALGAEPSDNKSNDILLDGASTTKFPTFKAIKDYVDQQSANAGVADNSITSAKINGNLAVLKGGTGASNPADARTNLGLVIGTDVMAANFRTTLTGDVTGSGNGSFATTINSVGGVSSSTIATLPGLITTNTNAIAANTASITANTNSIATLNTNVAANTASITANAIAIATNTASIATNATAITTEATTARAAELTLTNSVNANTASITANTNSIATLNTNVSANTASITANTNAIAANTTSITANSTDIATINTNLALKAPLASPAFTGTPTAPTPATNDNSTKVATTEYVKNSIIAANAGLSSIGAISGTSNAKGATISGTTELILTPADATNGGIVTTGAQTFAGAKTFTNTATFGTDIKVNGMNVGRPGMPTYTENTALGFGVLGSYAPSSSTYSYNTGVGNNALRSLTNGGNNTAVGHNALYYALTSRFNTAVGTDALVNSTESNNVGIGASSGVKLTTGRDNVMVGYIAGFGMTTGSNNTIVGSQTYSQTAGAIQIGLGITTGSNNTIIGSKIFGLAPSLSNNVILADGAGNIRAQHDGTTGWTLGTITSATWSATTIDIAKGGTGATTAAAALTNLGAEASVNKSTATDLGNTSPSDVLFPTQKAVKTYVDAQTASAGVSDGSITNAKLAGSITSSKLVGTDITTVGTITTGTWSASVIDIAHGGTGSSTVTGAKTNLGLNNVENTALSTWTGSSNITTVGALTAQTKTFMFQDLILGYGANNGAKIQTDASTKYLSFYPNYNVESTRMWPSGNVTIQTGGTFTDNGYKLEVAGTSKFTGNSSIVGNLDVTGNITSATWSGTTIPLTKGGTGATTAADARTNLGLVIGTDVMAANYTTTLTGDVTGAGNGSFATTLVPSGVNSGTYGSSTAIPVLTVDTKGRVTSASTVGITAGVSTLAYSTTGASNGGTISGTTLTLTAADASNPGLISTGAQTIAGAKTFSSNVTATNFLGNATTATTAGNITATSNTSLTSLANLATVGTITSGTWSATEVAIAKGGTGATTAAGARTNLGLGSIATKSTIADADVDASAAIAFSKLNITKANITSLGIQDGLTAGSGISLSSGTISVTGLTTSNLASNAAITNAQLANSSTTLGSTTMTLGGTVTSVTGLTSLVATNLTGTLSGTATSLATGRTISTTGDVSYTSGAFNGSSDVTGVATLAASGVSSGTYGSSSAIPVLTVDTKGRITNASTVAITAVTSLGTFTTTSYAAGGTISGTTLTLSAADATNPGLVSTGIQTFVGSKTFSATVTASGAIARGVNFAPTLTASANADVLAGIDINPTFNNSIYSSVKNYGLRVQNIGIGTGSGNISTNTTVGNAALGANTTGNQNTSFGYWSSMFNTTGSQNTAIGSWALKNNDIGTDNTAIGFQAMQGSGSRNYNTAIGSLSQGATSGTFTNSFNTSVGYNSLNAVTSGSDNVAIGKSALYGLTTANYNTALGSGAGGVVVSGSTVKSTGDYGIYLGYNAVALTTSSANEIVIGSATSAGGYNTGLGSNSTLIGNSATQQTKIYGILNVAPNTAPSATNGLSSTIAAQNAGAGNQNGGDINLTPGTATGTGNAGKVIVNGGDMTVNTITVGLGKNNISTNTAVGYQTLNAVPSGGGGYNTAIGYQASLGNTSGSGNVALGYGSLAANTTSSDNTAVGAFALNTLNNGSSSSGNVAVGSTALGNGQYLTYNTAVGLGALNLANGTSGSPSTNNTALGFKALNKNTTGNNNIGIGSSALFNLTTASNNTAIGVDAGSYFSNVSNINATGTNGVYLGYKALPSADALTNEIVIGANSNGNGSNTITIGNSSTTRAVVYGSTSLSNLPVAATSGNGGDFTLEAQDGFTTGNTNGGNINLTPGSANASGTAGRVNINSVINVAAGTATASTNGVSSTITAQNAGTGNQNGGDINLTPGTATGTGTAGVVKINGRVQITGGSPGAGEVLISDANGLATWSNAVGSTVVTSTTSYAITLAEAYVFYTGTAAGTFSIPAAASGNAGKAITIKNKTAFGITITPASGTIFIDSANTGAASVAVGIEASNNWIKLVSDGTQWNVIRALF